MMKKRTLHSTKLRQLGQMLELNDADIKRATMTMKTITSMIVITGMLMIINKLICSQLDPSGLYYLVPSPINNGILNRFF